MKKKTKFKPEDGFVPNDFPWISNQPHTEVSGLYSIKNGVIKQEVVLSARANDGYGNTTPLDPDDPANEHIFKGK